MFIVPTTGEGVRLRATGSLQVRCTDPGLLIAQFVGLPFDAVNDGILRSVSRSVERMLARLLTRRVVMAGTPNAVTDMQMQRAHHRGARRVQPGRGRACSASSSCAWDTSPCSPTMARGRSRSSCRASSGRDTIVSSERATERRAAAAARRHAARSCAALAGHATARIDCRHAATVAAAGDDDDQVAPAARDDDATADQADHRRTAVGAGVGSSPSHKPSRASSQPSQQATWRDRGASTRVVDPAAQAKPGRLHLGPSARRSDRERSEGAAGSAAGHTGATDPRAAGDVDEGRWTRRGEARGAIQRRG